MPQTLFAGIPFLLNACLREVQPARPEASWQLWGVNENGAWGASEIKLAVLKVLMLERGIIQRSCSSTPTPSPAIQDFIDEHR